MDDSVLDFLFATLVLCRGNCNLVPDVTFLSLSQFSVTFQRSLAAISDIH